LFAIAEFVGRGWPARARAAAIALSCNGEAEDDSIGVQLLTDIAVVFGNRDRITDFQTWDSLDLRALVSAERTFDGTINDPVVDDEPAYNVDDYVNLVDGAEGLTVQVKHQGAFVDVALLERHPLAGP